MILSTTAASSSLGFSYKSSGHKILNTKCCFIVSPQAWSHKYLRHAAQTIIPAGICVIWDSINKVDNWKGMTDLDNGKQGGTINSNSKKSMWSCLHNTTLLLCLRHLNHSKWALNMYLPSLNRLTAGVLVCTSQCDGGKNRLFYILQSMQTCCFSTESVHVS